MEFSFIFRSGSIFVFWVFQGFTLESSFSWWWLLRVAWAASIEVLVGVMGVAVAGVCSSLWA